MASALIIVVIVVAIAAVATAAVFLLRRSRGEALAPPGSLRPPVEDLAPMTGLESALERVTDRTGRPIRERIEAEASHVDDLRVPDDTGPLLRRALDHVARPSDATNAPPEPTDHDADDGDTEDDSTS